MHRGAKLLATVAVLGAAGCGGGGAPLEIRSTPTPLSATVKPVPARIAEGYGNLRLGNVALALESFRKALREQPASSDAMAGLAACYDRMARFDLSRRYYESALALAPADTRLLNAFAASLESQGDAAGAAAVRAEIRVRLAAAEPPPAAPAPEPAATPVAAAEQFAEAAAVPPAAVPAAAASVTVALPAPKPFVAHTLIQAPAPLAPTPPLAPKALPAIEAPAAREAAPLPSPPRPIERAAERPVAKRVQLAERAPSGPRLERLSLGEVALVTTPRPQWRAQTVKRTATSTTLRFVPLRSAAAAPPRVRLLNAARHHQLASNTRAFLAGRGWRQIAIGDAPKVRQTSLILYPAARRATAERLAAQFGFAIARRASGSEIVLLLGRDSVSRTRVKAG
ncbi:MAG: LytR C-terminal domain-containing protein [Sphingomicrobium sp.]